MRNLIEWKYFKFVSLIFSFILLFIFYKLSSFFTLNFLNSKNLYFENINKNFSNCIEVQQNLQYLIMSSEFKNIQFLKNDWLKINFLSINELYGDILDIFSNYKNKFIKLIELKPDVKLENPPVNNTNFKIPKLNNPKQDLKNLNFNKPKLDLVEEKISDNLSKSFEINKNLQNPNQSGSRIEPELLKNEEFKEAESVISINDNLSNFSEMKKNALRATFDYNRKNVRNPVYFHNLDDDIYPDYERFNISLPKETIRETFADKAISKIVNSFDPQPKKTNTLPTKNEILNIDPQKIETIKGRLSSVSSYHSSME